MRVPGVAEVSGYPDWYSNPDKFDIVIFGISVDIPNVLGCSGESDSPGILEILKAFGLPKLIKYPG